MAIQRLPRLLSETSGISPSIFDLSTYNQLTGFTNLPVFPSPHRVHQRSITSLSPLFALHRRDSTWNVSDDDNWLPRQRSIPHTADAAFSPSLRLPEVVLSLKAHLGLTCSFLT